MAYYWYRGRDKGLKVVNGYIHADHRRQALQLLDERGIWLTDLKEEKWLRKFKGMERKRRLKVKQLAPFMRQLAFAMSSGITLVNSLRMMESESNNPMIQRFTHDVLLDIQQGKGLYDTIVDGAWSVPAMVLELIAVGESRGEMDEALTIAADYLEHQMKMRSALVTALFYPGFVLMTIGIAMIIMMTYVVPLLSATYANYNVPLPWSTQLLINLSQWWQRTWWGVLVVLLVIGGRIKPICQKISQRPIIMVGLRHIVEKTPVVKKLVKQYYFVQFSYTLGQLLEGGILLLSALSLIQKNKRYVLYADQINGVVEATMAGMPLSNSLVQCSFVSAVARQMIAIGEESGRMGEMLLSISSYYDGQMRHYLLRMSKVVEPLLVVLLGMVVLMMIASLFLPMITSYQYMV